MSKSIADADLAAMSEMEPEIGELVESDSEWLLGVFALDRSRSYEAHAAWTWPRWRAHISSPVTAAMHLRVQLFLRASGEQAICVVVAVPEDDLEQFIGWASHARADQLRAWVELLDRELATLRSLWEAAGRPRGEVPRASPPSPAPPTGEPRKEGFVGRRLASGRFEITEIFGYELAMAAAFARDHAQGGSVWLTFASDVAGSIDELRALLARDVPGLAPVVYLDEETVDVWPRQFKMMAERLPTGASQLRLPSGPLEARELAAVGARLVAHVQRVHRGGMVLGSLRPETTFVTATGDITLAARGARLWLMPRPNMMKAAVVPPFPEAYTAPELYQSSPLLRDPAPAADVFSLGVMLASALLGEFVYAAEQPLQAIIAQLQGTHQPLPESPFGRLLARCLRVDPVERPTLDELEHGLSRQPD